MKILALEFSSSRRSAALVVNGIVRATSVETGGRAAHAFELIERALNEARMEREQVECVAVGLGPGSYTGIRAAIAVAQGWQLARPVKLIGIGGVEALTLQARDAGWAGKVNFIIDAQRSEFYLARFEMEAGSCREIQAVRLALRSEVESLIAKGETVAGPDIEKLSDAVRPLFPDAAALGQLAAKRTDYLIGEKLEPIYLREAGFVKAPPPRILPPG